jgi:hypothetical protein
LWADLHITANPDALLRRSPAAGSMRAGKVKKTQAMCIALNVALAPAAEIVSAESVVRVYGNLMIRRAGL